MLANILYKCRVYDRQTACEMDWDSFHAINMTSLIALIVALGIFCVCVWILAIYRGPVYSIHFWRVIGCGQSEWRNESIHFDFCVTNANCTNKLKKKAVFCV